MLETIANSIDVEVTVNARDLDEVLYLLVNLINYIKKYPIMLISTNKHMIIKHHILIFYTIAAPAKVQSTTSLLTPK